MKKDIKNLDQFVLEQDKIREKYIHDLVANKEMVHEDIMSILGLPDKSKFKLVHEDKYINGIIADFTLLYNGSVRAIIECKSCDIGVTDYVRGIGQTLQYEYFSDKKISSLGYLYTEDFNSILLIPSSVFKNNLFNVGRFKYPESIVILEINETNNAVRRITERELEEIGGALDDNLTTISQYYIRDNRLFELYLLLKYLIFLNIKGAQEVNRK